MIVHAMEISILLRIHKRIDSFRTSLLEVILCKVGCYFKYGNKILLTWRQELWSEKRLLPQLFNTQSPSDRHIFWYFLAHSYFESKNNGILLPKLFWPTVRKKCSSDREKLLKFEAEGREFAKFLRSLEQFIQTVKGQNNFCNRMFL